MLFNINILKLSNIYNKNNFNMSFRTKLDYSDNRQIKQREQTFTNLSGGTVFGLPFSGLTSGVDSSNTGTTEEYVSVSGNTFSGNPTTTIFTWSDSRISLIDSELSAITPSNSGITQNSGNIFVPSSSTIIDGNTVNLSYSGISIEGLTVTEMVEISPSIYTGRTTIDYFNVLSGGSLDYTGSTIWVDCTEIARTKKLIVTGDATFSNIGSNASAGALHYDANGVLTVNTSDERMKTKINTISNALEKVLNLRGVTYNWVSDTNESARIGFIAQEVSRVVPELTFVNNRTDQKLMGVHYQDVTALLVEAIKELITSNSSIVNREEFIINSQTVASEDNNIELNYNGTKKSALGGGIFVNKGIDENTDSEFLIDSNGNWVTNNYIKPFGLLIPEYTPTSSSDEKGIVGEMVRDDNYIYIKRLSGWGRCPLENF
jgi:hypothetical protein